MAQMVPRQFENVDASRARDKPVLEKRLELAAVVTGELIPEINRFDHDQVRQRALAVKP